MYDDDNNTGGKGLEAEDDEQLEIIDDQGPEEEDESTGDPRTYRNM